MTEMTLGLWRPLCGALVVGALALPGSALAQEGEEGSTSAEGIGVPRVLVLGFEDASDEDCNPKIARYGRCVEKVRFVDMGAAWSREEHPSAVQHAQWRNTASLYAQFWEDLSYRWKTPGDPIGSTLVEVGVERLPVPKQQWEATAAATDTDKDKDHHLYALPRSSSWLGRSVWVEDRQLPPGHHTDAFFAPVRFKKAKGLVPSPPMALLSGRFALRLAVDTKPHPYDIMDGGNEASAPFFEQMYPYARAFRQEVGESVEDGEIPLTHFVVDEALKTIHEGSDLVAIRAGNFERTLVPEDGFAQAQAMAISEFEKFYDLVGIMILRFAREEYTPTHLRVLTGLMAMESPPDAGSGNGLLKYDQGPNAGGTGETDEVGDDGMAGFGGFGSNREFRINYLELPFALINLHADRMEEWNNPTRDFLDKLRDDIIYQLGDFLREGLSYNPEGYPIERLDDDYVEQWIQNNAFPGKAPIIRKYFKRLAMDRMVERLDGSERESLETRILLDHVNMVITEGFGGEEAAFSAPRDLEGRTEEGWSSILNVHGMYPDTLDERPGVIDPLAICGVKSKLEALDEESWGPMTVDVLVKASASLTTVEELLWDVREEIPFIYLDNPEKTAPDVKWIVGLPGDEAIYRIRWKVWTGWHLAWGVEPLGPTADAPRRLALRTLAFCEDMVLTDPDLVATLVRASMLDGDFRPAVPVRDIQETKKPKKKKRKSDAAIEAEVTQGIKEGSDAERRFARDITENPETASRQVIRGVLTAKLPGKRRLGYVPEQVPTENVEFVRDLIQTKIRGLIGAKELIVTVFDSSQPEHHEPVWDYRPRTPYAQATSHVHGQGWVRTAGWAHKFERPGAELARTLISPAYLPTDLQNTAELKQVWKRRGTSDWTFALAAGGFPYSYTQYGCNSPDTPPDYSFVVDCALQGQDGKPYRNALETSGLSFDISALTTQWLIDDRRMAIEFGPEIRLDIVPPGENLLFSGDQQTIDTPSGSVGGQTAYPLNLRFQAGLIFGARWAPDPKPLWRSGTRNYPWGAPEPDGASALGRTQLGVRGGILVGPTGNGFEGTAMAEFWLGWSLRGKEGKYASFTPYQPGAIFGPFLRGQLGFPILPDSDDYLTMHYSAMAILGLRMQLRLKIKPKLPDAPDQE